jgi:glycosyltransferase involved in cell wall biosynthesis
VGDSVACVGEVQGDDKAAMFRSADLFVLPSFSENFGMVVAEALTYGVPVITTRSTPWADLEKFKCGWWIDTGAEPLIVALREAMSLSNEQRHAMGERGKLYASRFQWSNSAMLTAEVYRWLLNQGTRPGCVIEA